MKKLLAIILFLFSLACLADGGEFHDLVSGIKADGYEVEIQEEGNNVKKIIARKGGLKSEGKGLLGIRWAQKEVFIIHYKIDEENHVEFLFGKGHVEEKPPMMGQWRPIKKVLIVPDKWRKITSTKSRDISSER